MEPLPADAGAVEASSGSHLKLVEPPSDVPSVVRGRRVSPKIEARAVRLYREGYTLDGVAERVGMSRSGVRNVLVRNDVKIRSRKGSTWPRLDIRIDPALERRAIELYREDKSLRDVAEELGLASSTVGRILRRNGEAVHLRSHGKMKARRARVATPETKRLVELVKAGDTVREAAHKLGMTKAQAYQRLRWLECSAPTRPRITREAVEQVKALHAEGLSSKEIGKRIGRTRATVRNMLVGYEHLFDDTNVHGKAKWYGPELPTAPVVKMLEARIACENRELIAGHAFSERGGRVTNNNYGRTDAVCARAGITPRRLLQWRNDHRYTRAGLVDYVMQRMDWLWWEVFNPAEPCEGYTLTQWLDVVDHAARVFTGEGVFYPEHKPPYNRRMS